MMPTNENIIILYILHLSHLIIFLVFNKLDTYYILIKNKHHDHLKTLYKFCKLKQDNLKNLASLTPKLGFQWLGQRNQKKPNETKPDQIDMAPFTRHKCSRKLTDRPTQTLIIKIMEKGRDNMTANYNQDSRSQLEIVPQRHFQFQFLLSFSDYYTRMCDHGQFRLK